MKKARTAERMYREMMAAGCSRKAARLAAKRGGRGVVWVNPVQDAQRAQAEEARLHPTWVFVPSCKVGLKARVKDWAVLHPWMAWVAQAVGMVAVIALWIALASLLWSC